MMLPLDEPGTHRLFVNAMRGPLYSVSCDGKTVTEYLDVNAAAWGVNVQFADHERGVQSIAFYPQFNQRGTRGYGKFYRYTDTVIDSGTGNMTRKPAFTTSGDSGSTAGPVSTKPPSRFVARVSSLHCRV